MENYGDFRNQNNSHRKLTIENQAKLLLPEIKKLKWYFLEDEEYPEDGFNIDPENIDFIITKDEPENILFIFHQGEYKNDENLSTEENLELKEEWDEWDENNDPYELVDIIPSFYESILEVGGFTQSPFVTCLDDTENECALYNFKIDVSLKNRIGNLLKDL